MDKGKYKRLASLYVTGTELELREGIMLWMQVPNSFEYDECKHAAQVARSRVVLALNEVGSDELAKLEAQIAEEGREQIIDTLCEAKQGQWMLEATQEIVDDPDWSERIEVLEAGEDESAGPMSEEEKEYLAQVNSEYWAELNERMEAARKAERRRLESFSEADLREEYKDMWIERRGSDQAMAAYRMHEAYHAARACEATWDEGAEKWNHAKCEGHRQRAFDSIEELREMPDDLQELMVDTMQELHMSVREAKDSGSETSSSDSSPTPNEEEDSEPSAQAEAPETPPGT